MNKILLISKREFLNRVQKKTFLLTTIGLPILIFGFYALIIFLTVKNTDNYKIAIADDANILANSIKNVKGELIFTAIKNQTPITLAKQVEDKKFDAYVYVPAHFDINNSKDSLVVVSSKSVGLMTREKINSQIESALEQKKLLDNLHITKNKLDSLQQTSIIKFTTLNGNGDTDLKASISYGVGFGSGFMIYIILFIYGSMVMRGVMEEKTNRIAEVIVSSVKPFELMMGKIIGIGTVGLVQFLIWIFLMVGLQLAIVAIAPDTAQHIAQNGMQPGVGGSMAALEKSGALQGILGGLHQINFPLIIGCFLFYFLGGYFMYSALFAAVGSTVNDDMADAQSLMLPITLPIIFGMAIMVQAANNPNTGLAVFGSLFPLTSPIVMMARVAYGVPDGVTVGQLILSMVLLVVGFVGTTWVAGKIYRTGILMYGKKATYKDLLKWLKA
jgi:ABC-2 type transport system permease protein